MMKNIRNRVRIRIHLSEAWIRGSGSAPKCRGSATLANLKISQLSHTPPPPHCVRGGCITRWQSSLSFEPVEPLFDLFICGCGLQSSSLSLQSL